jgi:starvation-inducible DNA-binding protein
MYRTKNDLPEDLRSQVASFLAERLADAIDLHLQAKQAHWNVKGPSFIALHELFDRVADEVERYADLIAERIVQLGGAAEGTVRVAAERSTLDEYPLDIADGASHVEALSTALATFGRKARQAIDWVAEVGDDDAADIFTEVSRGIDKLLWFVEAHGWLEAEPLQFRRARRRPPGAPE